ncbi:MAG TPA: signal peptidase II [Parachlamydiales bacterium]|nr:signal peptidase II [Parachlamydiales bacterium]
MKYLFTLLLFALFALDVYSKQWAVGSLPMIHWHQGYPFGGIGMFELGDVTFSLNLVTNTGAAWGIFAQYTGALFIVRLAIICGLIFFLALFNKGKMPGFPMWLIVTGAFGNVFDYWRYGRVIDFLHFTFWGASFPVFNLADSYITLGALSLFLLTRAIPRKVQT